MPVDNFPHAVLRALVRRINPGYLAAMCNQFARGDGTHVACERLMDTSSDRLTTPPLRGASGAITFKRVVVGFVGFLVLLVLVIALLPESVWKSMVVYAVSRQTHREAAIDGHLKIHLFSWNPRITVDGFRLANADWKKDRPMLTVQRIDITVSLTSILRLSPVFPRIEIAGPDIDLERLADNRANWDFSTPGAKQPMKPDAGPATHIPVIKQLILSDGKLIANDRLKKLKFNGTMAVAEKQADRQGSNEEGALSVKGKGSLNDKPFEIRINGGPLVNVNEKEPYHFDLSVAAADIRLTAQTEIVHPFNLGAIRSKFHVTGQDLADVYYLTELALPNTPPYDVSGTIVRDNLRFQIDDFRGKLGSSDIQGKIAIDTGLKRPKLSAELSSKSLNIKDLAAPLGAQADAADKAGTLAQASTKVSGKSKGKVQPSQPAIPPEPALLLPDADLQVNRVRAMDADVKFDAGSVMTEKLPMEKVSFHLLLNDGQLSLSPLSFTLKEGRVSGNVSINARGDTPETTLDIKIDNVDLAEVKPEASTVPPLAGQLIGRIQLHGSGSSVHKAAASANGTLSLVVPRGEMRSAFAELMGINVDKGVPQLLSKKETETALRCAVFNFKAVDGDMKADTIVLDTTHVLVTGDGDINLNSEDINLSLKGKPKEVRVFRLRTPILIGGTLSHPKFGVEPVHVIGQTAAAVALGTLLTPIASILAFVDVGLAKDANCSQLVAQTSEDKNLPAAK